jgi:hypothetical protein
VADMPFFAYGGYSMHILNQALLFVVDVAQRYFFFFKENR